MKIALVHDYLKEYGGAERVLSALCEIFPEAPVYTIFCKKNSSAGIAFKDKKIVQSWFGKLPFCDKLISPLRFLIPAIWKGFNFSDYDLIISSASWAITKGFVGARKDKKDQGDNKDKKTIEICYCHTPPRYLYGYETSRNWKKNPVIRFYALIVNHFMRMYDFQQAQKVTYFIANSREVAGRIWKFYRRESEVINPPVEIPPENQISKIKNQNDNAKLKKIDGNYYLTGGRLEAAKNFDLIVNACVRLGVRLKIYGSGSREGYLKSIANENIEFLGWISDEEKFKLMAESKAFIVAATDEDFGITPVEAMASGTPVIAYKGGGYLETVIEGKTGVFFNDATAESLVSKLQSFKVSDYKAEDCRKQAEKFSKTIFKKKIKEFIDSHRFVTDLH